ncbi:A/G-specific adenine glycosylase [Novibacillus thermophilus]|jgi:A/G-specific adenine glycosylase|uniref:Adenine DNA glycosylase n=1 Tax=Novibacillus thermophilus TaxID=1471761 RepID=A0A1U9K427_9BACL|nr:A/G-specific adenine glycosylase [Novibacillus thermophilus]AQS54780.1 A/G-specific adenine glycosylase [Novibacillus thermophilus]
MASRREEYPLPDGVRKAAIQQNLLDWFKENKRDLPWRRDRDPYKVWVSEIMLQQTQVDTVTPYFNRFMKQFPTVFDLAAASEDEVMKAWEGLGYYARARNLHRAVRDVVAHYGGTVPDNKDDIARLKGVGPYTAGAILSIAYGKAEPAVDGNVMRVISRLFAIDDDITRPATRTKMEQLVRYLIPEEDPGAFNEGLMELGALVCTPQNPACLICPLLGECVGREQGVHEELPVKKTNKRVKAVSLSCGVVVNEGRVLLRQRPERGLLAGMWEFPNGEQTEVSRLLPELNVMWQEEPLGRVTHTFSHVQWRLSVYRGEAERRDVTLPSRCRWVDIRALPDYAFPRVFHKVRELAGI